MPIYAYICTTCDHEFEIYVRKMDIDIVACTQCGQDAKRGISKPSPFVWGRGGPFNG